MQYKEALEYLHSTLKFGSKLGLQSISSLLELMGNPHHKLRFVHVAGTNGKGSTVALISSILMEAGYKVGIFTSPCIERLTERIKINKDEISEEGLARVTAFVKGKVDIMVSRGENHPTEFEIVTAIAFQYFLECGCDIVVLEVGMGGRSDSTNVVRTPLASVITTISYDHMDKLGDTLPKIAFQKAGIIKEDGDAVIYPQAEEVERVFQDECAQMGARLHKVDFSSIVVKSFGIEGQVFDFEGYRDLKIALLGSHQVNNSAVAIKACELLRKKGIAISEEALRRGLENARWPGRLEIVNRNPLFLIDGAHNAEGARILADALMKYFPDRRKYFILGILKDKDYKSVVEAMAPLSSGFITVTPNSDRALSAKDLAAFVRQYCNNVTASDTIEEAVMISMEKCSEGDMICAFGSLYYVGEVRRIFADKLQHT